MQGQVEVLSESTAAMTLLICLNDGRSFIVSVGRAKDLRFPDSASICEAGTGHSVFTAVKA